MLQMKYICYFVIFLSNFNSIHGSNDVNNFDDVQTEGNFRLVIAHVNDVHARFEETNIRSGRCTQKDKDSDNCFGGFARIYSAVENLRSTHPNVLFLSAGDYYQGTIWYTVLKWKVMVDMINRLGHDAMALGNHEFDDGISGLTPFLREATFPVLAANIDHTDEPSMEGLYKKSDVIIKEGRKIGIIGYLTTETKFISRSERLIITDEVEAVRNEARRLKSEGVDIIIAVGHAGFTKDQLVAQEVEEVDVVVGGHSNTFLYNGESPYEKINGPYPTIVDQKNGRRVPVVQAYAFGKYLGVLELEFNDDGEVVSWNGDPILLDRKISQDPEILSALEPYREDVYKIVQNEVGRTYVLLDGSRESCRLRECNLGNLQTDAMVHKNAKYPDDMEWARTSLAMINGGGIRASIDELNANGTITLEDIMTASPFQNTIDIIEIKGKHLREAFEFSVEDYDPSGDLPGKFLQVSGIHVVYDLGKPNGQRVSKLEARCIKCRVPVMEEVKDDKVYKVAMTSFLANGGDGYNMIRENKINHHLTGLLDTDVMLGYISEYSPIYQGVENRIQFINSGEECPDNVCLDFYKGDKSLASIKSFHWSLLSIIVLIHRYL